MDGIGLKTSIRSLFFAILAACALAACNGDGGGGTTTDGGMSADGAMLGPRDGSVDAGTVVDGGAGTKQFQDLCTANAECASNLCYNYNARGMHCSVAPCTTANADTVCPLYLGQHLGCNGMGVCKGPQ